MVLVLCAKRSNLFDAVVRADDESWSPFSMTVHSPGTYLLMFASVCLVTRCAFGIKVVGGRTWLESKQVLTHDLNWEHLCKLFEVC